MCVSVWCCVVYTYYVLCLKILGLDPFSSALSTVCVVLCGACVVRGELICPVVLCTRENSTHAICTYTVLCLKILGLDPFSPALPEKAISQMSDADFDKFLDK